MITRELIRILRHYDANREVQITWEGTTHDMDAENVYQGADGILYLDGDSCSYRRNIIEGPKNKSEKLYRLGEFYTDGPNKGHRKSREDLEREIPYYRLGRDKAQKENTHE